MGWRWEDTLLVPICVYVRRSVRPVRVTNKQKKYVSRRVKCTNVTLVEAHPLEWLLGCLTLTVTWSTQSIGHINGVGWSREEFRHVWPVCIAKLYIFIFISPQRQHRRKHTAQRYVVRIEFEFGKGSRTNDRVCKMQKLFTVFNRGSRMCSPSRLYYPGNIGYLFL